MIKLSRADYEVVKEIFIQNNRGHIFDGNPTFLSSDEYNKLLVIFSGKKQRKIIVEYIKLLRLEHGDSFENHFEIKNKKSHYWKTDSGFYLGRVLNRGDEDYKIATFKNPWSADELTKSDIKNSDFKFNKVKKCDEEFL